MLINYILCYEIEEAYWQDKCARQVGPRKSDIRSSKSSFFSASQSKTIQDKCKLQDKVIKYCVIILKYYSYFYLYDSYLSLSL